MDAVRTQDLRFPQGLTVAPVPSSSRPCPAGSAEAEAAGVAEAARAAEAAQAVGEQAGPGAPAGVRPAGPGPRREAVAAEAASGPP